MDNNDNSDTEPNDPGNHTADQTDNCTQVTLNEQQQKAVTEIISEKLGEWKESVFGGGSFIVKDPNDMTDYGAFIPKENWGNVFVHLDAVSAAAVASTCKLFLSLVDTEQVWMEILRSYKKGISPDLLTYLPPKQSRERVFLAYQNDDLTKLQKLKLKYRIFACSLLVLPRFKFGLNDFTHPTHQPIVKKRIYRDIVDVLDKSHSGDFIFINRSVAFPPSLTITKSVHLMGPITKLSSGGEQLAVEFVCPTQVTGNISAYFTGFIMGTEKVTITDGAEGHFTYVLWSYAINLDIAKDSLIKISYSTVHCDKNDINFDKQFKGFVMKRSKFKKFPLEAYQNLFSRIDQLNSLQTKSPTELKLLISLIGTYFELIIEDNYSVLGPELDEKILKILYDLFCSNAADKVAVNAICEVFTKLFQLKEICPTIQESDFLKIHLPKFDWIDIIKKLLRSENDDIFCKVCFTVPNFISDPILKPKFDDEEMIQIVLDRVSNSIQAENVVYAGLWELWDHVHSSKTAKAKMLQNLPLLLKIIDLHEFKSNIQKVAFGVAWNLEKNLSTEVLFSLFKRAFKSSKGVQEASDLRPILGVICKVLLNAPEEVLTDLVKDADHGFFFKFLMNKEGNKVTPGIEETIWASIGLLCKIPTEAKKIVNLLKFSNCDAKIKLRCILLLLDAKLLTEDIVSIIKELTQNPEEKITRKLMDTIVYSVQTESPHKAQIMEIGKSLSKKLEVTSCQRSVIDWIPWLRMFVHGQSIRPESKFYFSPEKSILADIGPDGLLCKGQNRRGFTSAMTNKSVSTGKWYFEVEMLTCGLFQIGYINDKFKPDPEAGAGVGDDEHSWAVDLHRNKKWHKEAGEEDAKSYGIGTKWKEGGILQCYLDLDNKIMSFGYMGKDLGAAYYKNFEIGNGLFPAFSASSDEECRFNFGSSKFQFPDLEEGFRPLNDAD